MGPRSGPFTGRTVTMVILHLGSLNLNTHTDFVSDVIIVLYVGVILIKVPLINNMGYLDISIHGGVNIVEWFMIILDIICYLHENFKIHKFYIKLPVTH